MVILGVIVAFKALMLLTLMRPSLVLFLVLWLKMVKDCLNVRCRLALLLCRISCLMVVYLVASLPLIKERILVFFFFQAEDGIRDLIVTGVQTCALPISPALERISRSRTTAFRWLPFISATGGM